MIGSVRRAKLRPDLHVARRRRSGGHGELPGNRMNFCRGQRWSFSLLATGNACEQRKQQPNQETRTNLLLMILRAKTLTITASAVNRPPAFPPQRFTRPSWQPASSTIQSLCDRWDHQTIADVDRVPSLR